jgi:hypothetical protein
MSFVSPSELCGLSVQRLSSDLLQWRAFQHPSFSQREILRERHEVSAGNADSEVSGTWRTVRIDCAAAVEQFTASQAGA